MLYDRTFRFSASHYGPDHHAIVRKCEDEGHISWEDFKRYNAMLHGHNFVVRVTFEYPDLNGVAANTSKPFGVWDQALEHVVMEWKNCNISMHDDFYDVEWTSSTERIASVLGRKLLERFTWIDAFTVTVHETDDIFVTTTVERR